MAEYSGQKYVMTGQDNGVTIAADDSFVIGEVTGAGRVTEVTYQPEAASTGDNTNYRTYTLVNKGSDGLGTTVIATLALTTGVNLVAFDEKAATLSVVANAINVAESDVLVWVSTHTASGTVQPTIATPSPPRRAARWLNGASVVIAVGTWKSGRRRRQATNLATSLAWPPPRPITLPNSGRAATASSSAATSSVSTRCTPARCESKRCSKRGQRSAMVTTRYGRWTKFGSSPISSRPKTVGKPGSAGRVAVAGAVVGAVAIVIGRSSRHR